MSSIGARLACSGIRRNTSRALIASTESRTPKVQEAKMPKRGNIDAKATRRPSFTTAKSVLSTGTQIARRSPVSTASCRLNAHQTAVAATNAKAKRAFDERGANDGTHERTPAIKASETSVATTTLSAYDHPTRRHVERPAPGTKRKSALIRFSWAMPETSIIVEIAAAFSPTTSAL